MNKPQRIPAPVDPFEYESWLDQIVSLEEAARLRGVSKDTVRREDSRRVARGEDSHVLHLSVRRQGMRRRHALMLPPRLTTRRRPVE
jgi:hypothetical protein